MERRGWIQTCGFLGFEEDACEGDMVQLSHHMTVMKVTVH